MFIWLCRYKFNGYRGTMTSVPLLIICKFLLVTFNSIIVPPFKQTPHHLWWNQSVSEALQILSLYTTVMQDYYQFPGVQIYHFLANPYILRSHLSSLQISTIIVEGRIDYFWHLQPSHHLCCHIDKHFHIIKLVKHNPMMPP